MERLVLPAILSSWILVVKHASPLDAIKISDEYVSFSGFQWVSVAYHQTK